MIHFDSANINTNTIQTISAPEWQPTGLETGMASWEIMRELDVKTKSWTSYDSFHHNSIDFAYWLVNTITGDKATSRSAWPECFVKLDAKRKVENGGNSCFGDKA